MTALTCNDNLAAYTAVFNSHNASDNIIPINSYAAVANFKNTLMLKNVATYQLRVKVTTWICRHDMPSSTWDGALGFPDPDQSIANMIQFGFSTPYTNIPDTEDTPSYIDVSSNFFQNPLWLTYWRAIKTKTRVLMPYRTMKETLHVNKKRPGWIWRFGNGGLQSGDMGAVEPVLAACRNMGGITSCLKTLEIVGELVNDDTAAPNPTVFNSPMVLLQENKIEFEGAMPGITSTNWSAGDPAAAAPTEALTGQPWNYMFPTPSATSSFGTSCVVGAISSGL